MENYIFCGHCCRLRSDLYHCRIYIPVMSQFKTSISATTKTFTTFLMASEKSTLLCEATTFQNKISMEINDTRLYLNSSVDSEILEVFTEVLFTIMPVFM